jgi:hypothetical protein
VLKPIKTKTARASGAQEANDNYALREYGLTAAECAKAGKRISAEIKLARKRGEIKRFSGRANNFR